MMEKKTLGKTDPFALEGFIHAKKIFLNIHVVDNMIKQR
jgi:hypothetical protein